MSHPGFFVTLRGKLTVALLGAALLVLPPVVAAAVHIHRLNELDRAQAEVEQQHARSNASERRRHERRIRELRDQFSLVSDQAYRDVLTLAALSLLVLGVVTVVLPRRVLRPLRRLTTLLGQAEGGRLDVAQAEVTPDEIGELAHRMNVMFGQLSRLDRLRRDKITDLAEQRNALLEWLEAPAVLLDGEERVVRASRRFGEAFDRDVETLVDRPLLAAMEWTHSGLALAPDQEGGQSLELGGRRYDVELRRLGRYRLLLMREPTAR